MTSRTGWREAARMSAKRTFAVRRWPLSRIVRRMVSPSGCGLYGCECRLVLPRGLADRGADDELEDLVFGQAGHSSGRDITVGDLIGVPCDLLDNPAHRLWKSCVVESGTSLGGRRIASPVQDSRYKGFSRLSDVRHLPPPCSRAYTNPLESLLSITNRVWEVVAVAAGGAAVPR